MKGIVTKAVPLFKTFLVFVVFVVLGQLLYNLSSNYFNQSDRLDVREPTYIVLSSLYCLYVIVFSLIACRYIDKRNLSDFNFKISLKDIFLSIIALCIIFFGYLLVSIVLKEFGIAIWYWTNVPLKYVLFATIIYLTVGLNEEIFFRGYLFKSLTKYGKIPAYIISIVLFSAIHFTQQDFSIGYLIELLVASFVLTYLFDVTGSIWPSIIIHAGYDLFVGLFGGNITKASLINWEYLDNRYNLNDIFNYQSIIYHILIFILFVSLKKYYENKDIFR